ncbi:MAG: CPBP family intramembrane metalloprotease [Methanomassiliicoccaceae archaeon]|nr:CPBP family intramembrane metalloprotease [Methanomassiliicoccaceae archaeon]
MNDECPECRDYAADGRPFCGACGRSFEDIMPDEGLYDSADDDPLYDTDDVGPERTHPDFIDIFFPVLCAFFIFIAVFEAIVLAVHSGDVFSFLSNLNVGFYILTPSPEIIFRLQGSAMQAYWVILVIIILLCVAVAIWNFIKTIRDSGGVTRPGAVEGTAVFWVSILLCAYVFVTITITYLLLAAGSGVTSPFFGDETAQMFFFANASVWEEIITRLLFIGVPMAVISLIITKKKESLRCLLGGFGMSTAAVIFIIISGAIFGLAHYSGWDDQAWKVITTGMMGIFLGYVFVRFGLYASILMHFIMDYLSSFLWIGGAEIDALVTMLIFGVGFVALCYIVWKLLISKESIESLPLFRNGYGEK